jgi:hypothetical protein
MIKKIEIIMLCSAGGRVLRPGVGAQKRKFLTHLPRDMREINTLDSFLIRIQLIPPHARVSAELSRHPTEKLFLQQ